MIVDVDPECSNLFCGDPLRLRQILLNLLSNAVKFADTGDIEICVAQSPAPGGRTALDFSVRDDGASIRVQNPNPGFPSICPFTPCSPSHIPRFSGS